jgi:hypothetical protein
LIVPALHPSGQVEEGLDLGAGAVGNGEEVSLRHILPWLGHFGREER